MTISQYNFDNATGPFSPNQTGGGVTTNDFAIVGSGASFDGTHLNMPAGTSLNAGALGIALPTDTDPALTQTPELITLEYIGILPTSETPLVSLYRYNQARFALFSHWDAGRMRVQLERDGTTVQLDSDAGLSTSTEEQVGVRYEDDAAGSGGTVTFLRNGVAFGASQAVAFKLRITPDAELESNASLGNTSNSAALKVKSISVSLGATSPPPPPPPPPSGSEISQYNFDNATGPFSPNQTGGGVTTNDFTIVGSGASFDGTHLNMPAGTSLNAGALGIALPTDTDPALTQTPELITLEYIGILPTSETPLVSLYRYNQARFALFSHWDAGRMRVQLERDGTTVQLDSDAGLSTSTEEQVGVRYEDDAAGSGGTVTFLRNGVAFGASQAVAFKLRITPDAELESNASLGNTSNSAALKVKSISVSLGATSPPPPPPPPPSGSEIYGKPGTKFAMGLVAGDVSANYDLTIPSGLSLEKRVTSNQPVESTSGYVLDSIGPNFSPQQNNGGVSAKDLSAVGSAPSFDGTYLNLSSSSSLDAGALGISLPSDLDPLKSEAPISISLGFTGILPTVESPLVSLYDYAKGQFSLYSHWQSGIVRVHLERNGQTAILYSDAGLSNSVEEQIEVRYDDDPNGSGGTVTFFRNGTIFGSVQTVNFKVRITPQARLEHNASLGNTSNSTSQKISDLYVQLETVGQSFSYVPVSSGTVSGAELEQLFVNAEAISSPQPAQAVTYGLSGGVQSSIDVIIGPLVLASGVAYRAVLEDWSSGSAIDHPNDLIMTQPVRQNCQFEDSTLAASQPNWMECLSEGTPPSINNIVYYCEAIRAGDYVQFQFGYDWDEILMPDNPFGDPTGNDSYMVPHKWRIEDKDGTVLETIERADGGALNGTDVPRIFNGNYDSGTGAAITNSNDRWHPHGTVRAGVIWRSNTPENYNQVEINASLPRYDATVPYSSHTHFSTNGFDARIFGSGNFNGFGNTRVMPFEPTDYATLTPQVGVTSDPYTGSLYNASSLKAVASTWLEYTPFNQCGRSPITGPGGVRDDRAAIAEPVGQYMHDIASSRPHDGKAFKDIALDYLTSYASEPFHCFEDGRCVPLFKGTNANRNIGLRGHYYGYGEASRPASSSYYVQGGRQYEMADSYDPWSAKVPYGGVATDKPYFGTNEIDLPHAHQFPHWGSLLWKTPEFAFLGHKLSDQARLYEGWILSNPASSVPDLIAERGAAWQFLHAALIWKTASRNSDRLYSREEILNFVVDDFETFNSQHKTSNPGFDNPPANIGISNGNINYADAIYAAVSRFGIVGLFSNDVVQHDFFIGYWLTALGIAERIGFNAAIRSESAAAGSVLDWLISKHRQRIVGRINDAPRVDPATGTEYLLSLWTEGAINSVNGNVSALAQSYGDIVTQNGNAPTWDVYQASNGTALRDGQAMDQMIAGPSTLKVHLNQSGSDLDTAENTAIGWRNQKKTEQEALGLSGAGTTWFKYLQSVHNPVVS